MTLSGIIQKITSRPARYGCRFWNYRISGNILELTIKADHSTNPEEYREGIIKIGQVLETIEHQALSKGYAAQINSFPDLGNSRLVALIRLYQMDGGNNVSDTQITNNLQNNTDKKNSTLVLLKSIASHYGLFFQNHSGKYTGDIRKQMLKDGQTPDPDGSYFSLCTMMDNPFVWIKTGQWMERVRQLKDDQPNFILPAVTCRIPGANRYALNKAFTDCSYVQALVQLQKAAFTTL